jgi:glutamate--cysteine ligase
MARSIPRLFIARLICVILVLNSAPVDTNLFPGGFNNLALKMLPLAVQAAMAAIEKICPEARNLLLIPERHTRNIFYLQNVARLVSILRQTGLNVRLGTLSEEIKKTTTVDLPDGQTVNLRTIIKNRSKRTKTRTQRF